MLKTKIGLKGEEIAKAYLQKNKVCILREDYRFLKCQVDLIGLYQNRIIAYEVKTTQDPTYEEHLIYRLSARQLQRIQKATFHFMKTHGIYKEMQVDFLGITLVDQVSSIQHVADIEYFIG